MVVVGPNGSARYDFFEGRRLAVNADAERLVVLTDLQGVPIDLNPSDVDIYTSFSGSGRRERNEVLTTPSLFLITVAYTLPGPSPLPGSDGGLTLSVAGSQLGQDTPIRGHYDIYGLRAADSKQILLLTGRWECQGGTFDPLNPI